MYFLNNLFSQKCQFYLLVCAYARISFGRMMLSAVGIWSLNYGLLPKLPFARWRYRVFVEVLNYSQKGAHSNCGSHYFMRSQ